MDPPRQRTRSPPFRPVRGRNFTDASGRAKWWLRFAPTPPPPLAPPARGRPLDRLERERFDCVVIGGGITGAGIAREAARRGLAVALLEASDYAAGTSSRSSKLIHGGLRYLAMGDVALVRSTALERKRI